MMQVVESYLTRLLNLDQIKSANEALEVRVRSLENKVNDLEKSNEDLSRSVAAVAIIQANLLRELQTAFNSARKATHPVFVNRKTDDYTN